MVLLDVLDDTISDIFSDRYNGKYRVYDFAVYLTEMCSRSCTAAAARKFVENKRTPSEKWFRNMAHKLDANQLELVCKSMVEEMVNICRKSELFQAKDVLVAIDKHLIPRYDRGDITGLVRSQLKQGSTLFECYATMQVASGSVRAILDCIRVTPCMDNAELVGRIISSLSAYGIKERLLLLDREFFSVKVIRVLQDANRRYLMPARKHAGIKKAIDEFVEGTRSAISEYTMVNSEGVAVTITLIIKKIGKQDAKKKKKRWRSQKEEKCMGGASKKKKKKEESVYDQYIVFATNLTRQEAMGKIGKITKAYRNRWRIEIGYRQMESIRPWTTSKVPAYHFLLFLASMFMHNMWEFERTSADVDKSEMTLKSLVENAVNSALAMVPDIGDPGGGGMEDLAARYRNMTGLAA